MKKLIILMVFHFCFFSFCGAQDNLVDAKIDIKKEKEAHLTFSGKAKNLSSESKDFTYTLHLTNKDSGNSSTSKQSGKFTLLPQEEKILSSSQINVSPQANFDITLKIYQGEQVVAEQVLSSNEAFFKAYNALPITPTKKKSNTQNTTGQSILKPEPTNENVVDSKSDAIEIGGLIIDDTRSKIGRDFYDAFYGKWSEPSGSSSFSVIIKELPAPGSSRGRSSRIAVEVDGSIVIERFVQPRQELIELLAQQAVNVVHSHLKKKKQLNKDLGSDDQQGSGIF